MYTKKEIYKSLKELKLKKNDSIYVSSSFGMLGRPDFEIKNINDLCRNFFQILQEIIGDKGTIFCPTFTYSFSTKKNIKENYFDVKKTVSKVGPFGEFIRKFKSSVRSPDPMISVTGLGNDSAILKNINKTSYGKKCIFDQLKSIDKLKILNVGVGPNYIPFLHHIDYLTSCKHRYDKYFKGYIVENNEARFVKWHYPVAYKKKWAGADGHRLANLALNNIISNTKLGIGNIYVSNYSELFDFCLKKSKKNPWITAVGKKV